GEGPLSHPGSSNQSLTPPAHPAAPSSISQTTLHALGLNGLPGSMPSGPLDPNTSLTIPKSTLESLLIQQYLAQQHALAASITPAQSQLHSAASNSALEDPMASSSSTGAGAAKRKAKQQATVVAPPKRTKREPHTTPYPDAEVTDQDENNDSEREKLDKIQLQNPNHPFPVKRKKNTLASQRFRAKKKERDLALQSHAKELEDKVKQLQDTLKEKEMEIKFLRGLVLSGRVHGDPVAAIAAFSSAPTASLEVSGLDVLTQFKSGP
ncbi:hypothetical protein HDU91_002318, partial [Kappamyces sp. JEL0680]